VHGDGSQIEEAYEEFEPAEAQRVRAQARRLGVSAATLFHAAWALVIAHTSDRDDVVFGSVLLGRLQGNAGAQRILGMFINTLPLRLRLGDVSAKDLVERTQRELVDLLSHEQASLAVAQRCSGVVGSAPLFTALLNYRHSVASSEAQWSQAKGISVRGVRERTNYPVTLSVDDFGEGLALSALTDHRIDARQITAYLRTAVLSLVAALEEAPQTPALKLQVLPEAERRRVLEEFNATQMPYPREQLIHELFEEQVRRTPAAIAVTHGGESLTYDELNRRSNQLARHLRERGVNPDQLVGICVGRGVRMAVGLLGILKAGGAYVPLDPSYPAERLQHMLLDAEPGVVLTEDALRPIVPPSAARIVSLDALHDTLGGLPDDNLVPAQLGLASGHLVYVIYTSGSTGRPKGTNMPHRAMVNLVEWHRATFQARAPRVLQFAALSFDVAFQETFSTLCTGGTLVYLDEWVRKDAGALMELLADQRIDRLFLPPLMLQTLADYARATRAGLSGVKDVIVAGEQLRIGPEIVDLFRRLPGTRLHNHYGPTETHVVTALTLSGDPVRWPALPTIGRSIANTRIHILDGHLQPVGIGVVGEIYIAGANVARGYRNRSELDAERFLPDRFGADVESRMYKTGDLGRWRSDGTIEYLGRNDHQVKIRGFRVEMGEIESQLARHPAVREAAVVVRADGRAEKRLVAYVVSRDRVPPGVEELRAHLKATLPEHMVPYAFVFLDAMPLTPSGKLNRGGLPSPEIDSSARSQHEPPRGKTEETLAEIWRELLAVTQVGRHDDFFELGGHSILALQALLQINMRLRCALGVADIYKSPTLQDLASRVAGALVEDPWVDLEREAALHSDIVHMAQTPGATTQAVMLTGATGFIGRFLLAQLLRDTRAIIYCLIRARSKRHASARLRATLLQWDLMSEDFDQRIVCIPADLRQPRLGMDEDTWSSLAQKVDCVYHCATSMNHLETYAMARPANVDAARELLRFATSGRPKLVNYISTLGIFSAAADDPPRVIHEASSIDHERHRASQGYLASKWVAEKLFMMAQSRGIACNIFRLGLAWADARHGRFDELQHVYRVLKTCLLTGYGIKNYRYPMPPTPVDYIARAVVALAERHRGGHGIFHISSSEQMRDGVFERCNEVMGTSLELVPYYDWICEIKRLHGLGRLLPVVPLVEYAFDMDRESFERHQRSLRWVANLRFNLGRTHGELEQAGIAAPVLDDNLLLICLRGMIARDAELQVCIDDGALRTESDAPDQESPALRPYPADRQRDEAKRL
jgi:amino acid adenylation domain-containing protein/thioester reductase-like protein